MIALFIGRFQPLHLGHLDALKQIAKEFDTIKIGIGSSNEKGTENNPYDFELRKKMILSIEKDIHAKVEIFALPDFNDDEKWLSNTLNTVGEFDIAFTGNNHVDKLFKENGYKTKNQVFNLDISGTKVRKLINCNEDYQHLLPKTVGGLLKEVF